MTQKKAPSPEPAPAGPVTSSRTLRLPARMNYAAADELSEAFEHLRDSPIEVDASEVTHLGAIGLQVLMAARTQWQLDGVLFRLTGSSPAFTDSLRLLGVPPDTFFEQDAVQ